jgi:hypothetical protein
MRDPRRRSVARNVRVASAARFAHASMMRLLLVVAALVTVAHADPRVESQPLACPNNDETCELAIEGKLVFAKRSVHAKWDNLEIATMRDGKDAVVHASINIPHRTRLKLKTGARYRFQIAASKPFGAGDLWVIGAEPKAKK